MEQRNHRPPKQPGLLTLILESIREARARHRLEKDYERAHARLDAGDTAPMQRLADLGEGDAWLALAEFHERRHPDDAAKATDAYREAVACRTWRKDGYGRAREAYDRRRFLGIGVTQDFHALAEEWRSGHLAGYLRETQLAWIFSCGPLEMRDYAEAWRWMAVAEARWRRARAEELPSGSVDEIVDLLMKVVPEAERIRSQEMAKDLAYQEFVEGK